jgi:hypothetical protein
MGKQICRLVPHDIRTRNNRDKRSGRLSGRGWFWRYEHFIISGNKRLVY